jgi:hypothetical protein
MIRFSDWPTSQELTVKTTVLEIKSVDFLLALV